VLVLATLLVVAGTPVVYAAHVHPTILYAVLAYLGRGIVAVLTSGPFADQHLGLVLSAAFILNLAAFSIPIGLIWLLTRSRAAGTRAAVLWGWGLVYLAFLYFVLPVPLGP
jgi:hypothetical protein